MLTVHSNPVAQTALRTEVGGFTEAGRRREKPGGLDQGIAAPIREGTGGPVGEYAVFIRLELRESMIGELQACTVRLHATPQVEGFNVG